MTKETMGNNGFGACASMMAGCSLQAGKEEEGKKMDFNTCQEIMKNFCGSKAPMAEFMAGFQKCCSTAAVKAAETTDKKI